MNMDEHGGFGETNDARALPSELQVDGSAFKKEGIKGNGRKVSFSYRWEDEFSLAKLGRQIFSFRASQHRRISRVTNGVARSPAK